MASRCVPLVAGALLVNACSDPTANWRKPELVTCERFIRAGLKVPSSFRREWYHIADFPVSRALLAEATGDRAQAATAPNPGVRRIFIQYAATNGMDETAAGNGLCLFPMTDAANGTYAADIERKVDEAIVANEQRALQAAQGKDVVSAECCVMPGFDRSKLTVVNPVPRGSIPAGRKL
jgi:hypothetical protein